jgi:hypothetical protein
MEWEFGSASAQRRADDEAELENAEANVQRLVWAVAGLFVAASVVASVTLIRGHLNHFTQPIVQSKVRSITPALLTATLVS